MLFVMPERLLSAEQKQVLADVRDLLFDPKQALTIFTTPQNLQEGYNLSRPNALVVIALLCQVFNKTGNDVHINPRLKRQCMSVLVNNPPGQGQLLEEQHGVRHIPGGYHRTGRNVSGRRRAGRP